MVNLPCQAVSVDGPNAEIGKYSVRVHVVFPDGSVVVLFTDDLDKAATSIEVNNAVAAAAIKAYKAWGGNLPLAPAWDGVELITVNLIGGAV